MGAKIIHAATTKTLQSHDEKGCHTHVNEASGYILGWPKKGFVNPGKESLTGLLQPPRFMRVAF